VNLTPGALVALAAAALLGILAQWSDSLLATFAWRALVALVVVGLAYELYVTRRLSIGAAWAGRPRLYLGRAEQLGIELTNRTRRKLALAFVPVFPDVVRGDVAVRTVLLEPSGAQSALIGARAVQLGAYVWPPLAARVKGPRRLGWGSRAGTLDGGGRGVADTLGPRGGAVGSSEGGSTAQAALGGGRELHHLRAYASGDPRHTIDWKATARTTRLVTRVFSEDQHLEVMVLLDAGRTSRTEIDGMHEFGHYANLAARFAEYCVAGDDEVGFIAFADRPIVTLPPARGMHAVTRIRHALANLAPLAVESDVLAAALHVRKLVRHRCLVVILTDLYERSATSQLAQSVRLLVPKHLPMIAGLLSEEVLELAQRRAVDWLDPYRGLAAREYQRHVHGNVARLAQLGAHALVARPSDLDRKVFSQYRLLRTQHRI
jgi:uncharacterized protein (DUF58 family)